jgi:serine O-acetyltransferase
MHLSLDHHALTDYTTHQLDALFPDRGRTRSLLGRYVGPALERLEHCLGRIRLKYFQEGDAVRFDHLHTDQYATYLYFLSNTIHRSGGEPGLAKRLYALNKALHGLDLYHEVALPDIFALQHPVGTVLGRASYADYLFVYQSCCVGVNLASEGPRFGEGVVLFPGSMVLGACTVGANAWFAAGTIVVDTDVPPDSMVFGRTPALTITPTRRTVAADLFGLPDPQGTHG